MPELSAVDITDLSRAVGYSRKCLKTFREKRLYLMKQYVGKHYSDNGSTKKVPVNLLELAMNIYLQRLVAQAPAVNITTEIMKLKELSTRFELAGNHLIQEIDLGDTLEMAVVGAMFSMGIIKVGLNRTQVEIGGYLHDTGQPFADYVSLDDWVHDMTVDRFEQVQFEGNYYNMTIDEALEVFPKSHDKLIPQDEQIPERRDHDISEDESNSNKREEFRKTVRCLDLWLPKQNLILQCQAADPSEETDPIANVLNIIEWEGPERGPYHKLGFGKIENNTMPLAPASHMRDLHELTNKIFNKLGRQAVREKTILGVQRGSEKDGQRILDANDGEAIAMDNPKAAQEYRFGGISQESFGFSMAVKDLFSYMAGNLDMLGGLGPQSETLGQDQLLSASASMRIQKMQKRTISFTQGVVKDLCFYLFTDPYINLPLTKRVKGFDEITIPVSFTSEDREGDFLEYNIKIEPYSMQHQTPEAKLQGLRTIFQEMLVPMMPIMQQQGITLDFEALFRKIAKLGNIPELNDILVYSDPHLEPKAVGEPPQKAAVTKRTYERVNRPGATDRGKSQIIQQAAFGGNPQQSEKAAAFRPTN